jgi:hypothetical protein
MSDGNKGTDGRQYADQRAHDAFWMTAAESMAQAAPDLHPNKQQNVGESRTGHFNDGYSDACGG